MVLCVDDYRIHTVFFDGMMKNSNGQLLWGSTTKAKELFQKKKTLFFCPPFMEGGLVFFLKKIFEWWMNCLGPPFLL